MKTLNHQKVINRYNSIKLYGYPDHEICKLIALQELGKSNEHNTLLVLDCIKINKLVADYEKI